jgi:hypothetical protein
MPKIDVTTIADFSHQQSDSFSGFVDVFQTNIINLTKQQAYNMMEQDREYMLDDDGYIIGDVWSESIASELITVNNLIPTLERINALIEARAIFGAGSVPLNYKDIAELLNMKGAVFLKLFPKFPIIYLTRWGNLRKPTNLKELIANPVRR